MCQQDINRYKGCHYIQGKMLCNGCHPGYVVHLRQVEREEREARNIAVEG